MPLFVRAARPGGGRRRRRLGATISVVALVAAGCSGSSSPAPEAARPAQDLRVLVGQDPFGGNGQGGNGNGQPAGQGQAGQNQAGQNQGQAGQNQGQGRGGAQGQGLQATGPLGPRTTRWNLGIFETLTKLTPTFGVSPGLAARWESVTPTKWRFTLRPNVVFHNGTPLDAAAVVATLQAAARRQDPIRGLDENGVRAVGDHVVEIDLTVANLRLPEQFATPSLGIMAPDTVGGRGEDAATTATGTGPFRFGSYTAGENVKVVANDRYWGGKPRLRSITFRFTKQGDDPVALLADGEIDVALESASAEPAAPTKAGKAVLSTPSQAVSLLLNSTGTDEYALLGDEAVRKAVALAVDRQGFTTAAWAGRGKPNETVVPPSVLGASSGVVATPAGDLDAARSLLDGAGWVVGPDGARSKDARPLVLTLLLGNTQDRDAAIGAVQDQLGSVGIGVELQQPAGAAPLQLVNQGRFHLYLDTRLQDDANPCSFCRLFTSRPGGLLSISTAVTGGPEVDELYERAFTEPTAQDAGRFAADLLHVVTAERFVIVPLSLVGTSWLVAPYVRGFVAAPFAGAQTWQGTWLAV